MTNFTDEEMEAAAIVSAENFGQPKDMFHPDYGWILRDGKLTEVGKEFCKKYLIPSGAARSGTEDESSSK